MTTMMTMTKIRNREIQMASKKKKKKIAKKKASKKAKVASGKHRKCAVCRKLGHNKRSHEPGGKLA